MQRLQGMAWTLCPLNIEVETLTSNVTGVEGDTKMEIIHKYRPCSRRIIVAIRNDTRELTLLIPVPQRAKQDISHQKAGKDSLRTGLAVS